MVPQSEQPTMDIKPFLKSLLLKPFVDSPKIITSQEIKQINTFMVHIGMNGQDKVRVFGFVSKLVAIMARHIEPMCQ